MDFFSLHPGYHPPKWNFSFHLEHHSVLEWFIVLEPSPNSLAKGILDEAKVLYRIINGTDFHLPVP
jgi:hypothetical protein